MKNEVYYDKQWNVTNVLSWIKAYAEKNHLYLGLEEKKSIPGAYGTKDILYVFGFDDHYRITVRNSICPGAPRLNDIYVTLGIPVPGDKYKIGQGIKLDSTTSDESTLNRKFDAARPQLEKLVSKQTNESKMNQQTLKFKKLIQEKVREVLRESEFNKNDLHEGTWAFPETAKQKSALNHIIDTLDRNPAYMLLNRLYGLLGDDELFDSLENLYKNTDKKASKLISDRYKKLDDSKKQERISKLEQIKGAASKIQKTLENTKKKKKK